jgi:hypothetical protein
MAIQWRFTASDGQIFRLASCPTESVRLLLTYDPQAGWEVDQDGAERLNGFGLPAALADNICSAGSNILSPLAQVRHYGVTINHDNRLQGCEIQAVTADGASAGRFVCRFGVLLAADAQAHAAFPDLPLAPSGEVAAVGAE